MPYTFDVKFSRICQLPSEYGRVVGLTTYHDALYAATDSGYVLKIEIGCFSEARVSCVNPQ